MNKKLVGCFAALAISAAMTVTAFAGQWRSDTNGWWYQNDDGSYPAGTWQWIDGNGDGIAECYYFYPDGYMAYNNDVDGYHLNSDGQWTVSGRVQKRSSGSTADLSSVSLDVYKNAILNKSIIEGNSYFDYLKMYFREGYGFDKYFLHDLNDDGIPEMFVYSTNMGLTAVYTIDNGLKLLGYADICGINIRSNEAVVYGHWHGAGGSGENEWHTYAIKNGSLEMTRYIDHLPYDDYNDRYTYYRAATDSYDTSNKEEYDNAYKDIMNGFRTLGIYRMYNLGDTSGLSNIQ